MPDNTTRKSMDLNLDGRYHNQRAGGAFDVKQTLEQPHTSVPAGKVIDASSAKGQEFQSPNGFETRVPLMVSRMKVVQSNGSQGLSSYVKGLDNRKYGNSVPFHTT